MIGGKIRLIRKLIPEPGPKLDACGHQKDSADESRKRIQGLVDELSQVNTKADIRSAETRGLPFNHEGFASWCGVGTDTLRKKNGDLYDLLKARLAYLERVAGRPLRGRRAKEPEPADTKQKNRQTRESDEMDSLRQELHRERALRLKGEAEILRLAALLRSALHSRSA